MKAKLIRRRKKTSNQQPSSPVLLKLWDRHGIRVELISTTLLPLLHVHPMHRNPCKYPVHNANRIR